MIKDKPSTNLIENSELAIKLYDALERLSSNEDFKVLIEEGFMKTFALNQVGLLAHPGTVKTMDEGSRNRLQDNLLAVSVLENFLITIEILGERAKAQAQEEALTEFDDSEE